MWLLNKLTMPSSKRSPNLPYDHEAIDKALAANNNDIFTPDSFNELYTAALASQEPTGDYKEQYRRHNLLYGLLERRTGKKLKLALNDNDKAAQLLTSRTEFLNLAVIAFLESDSDSGSDVTMVNAATLSKATAASLGGIGTDGNEASENGHTSTTSVSGLEADTTDLNSDYETLAAWRDKLQAHADWLNGTEAALREKDHTIEKKWREAEKTKMEVMEREKAVYKAEKEIESREKDVAKKEKELRKNEVEFRENSFSTNQLTTELRNVRRALNQAEQEKQALESQVATMEMRNAASERLEREKQKINNLNHDELGKLATEIRLLRAGNDVQNGEIVKLKTKIRELEEEKCNTNRLHTHEITKLSTKIRELETKNSNDHETHKEQMAQYKTRINDLEDAAASTLHISQEKVTSDQKRQVDQAKAANLEGNISQLQKKIFDLPNTFIPDHVAARIQLLHSAYSTSADRKQFKTEVADLWAPKQAVVGVKLDSIKEKLKDGLVVPSARELRDVVGIVYEVMLEVKKK
ncbi:hypothetical protein AC579_7589 [Pseudocercospora musae]|uniref:Uncharacterized protein n=1 Tax=Pseudocercospora musae TaxID=113226 RepID=A0A139H3Q2_9PEZI|nr:hypothetical protein AC579_7589 [Pseudocercospora musae]